MNLNQTLIDRDAAFTGARHQTEPLGELSLRWLPIQFDHDAPPRQSLHPDDGDRILAAAREILRQGEDLLRAIPSQRYHETVPAAFNACIGGHYRHCLDHFASVLRGLENEVVDYDRRERDPRVESDPSFALALTRSLQQRLATLAPSDLARPAKTRCEISYGDGGSPLTCSSYARELVYAIAHAIHHYALISVMARLADVTLPAHFGLAPSTLAHQRARQARITP